jgi:hypothetical protein
LSVDSGNVLAGIGNLKIAAQLAATLRAWKVDSEHVLEFVELCRVFGAARHRDGGAVHVELWLSTQFRDPAPCESGLTVGNLGRDGVVPGHSTAICVVDWAATNPGGDCLELAVGGGSSVKSYAELT